MSRIFTAVFLFALLASSLWADAPKMRVTLDNGDRLSGSLVFEDEQVVRLSVAYLGEVALQRSRITSIEAVEGEPAFAASEPALVPSDAAGSVPLSIEEKFVEESSDEEVQAGGLVGLLALWEREFNPLPKWKKSLQFGYNAVSGQRDQSTLNYRLEMNRKIEKNRLSVNADYLYGQAGEVTNLDKFSTLFQWRKDISPRVFYEAQSLYFEDEIRSIDYNFEQKLGLGKRLMESDSGTFSAGFAAVGRWRDIGEEGLESDSLVNLFQDWDYRLTDKVRVQQDFKFAMPVDEGDDYQIAFAAALRSAVTQSINLSVRYELGIDNSLPEAQREERRLISSLGYAF